MMRIAILAHSTSPRGGVVHALEVAEALTRLGHEAVVHAPDPRGAGFFREAQCETVSVKARKVDGDVAEMVRCRVAEYVAHFSDSANRRFDVFHAQDSISGNALAGLKAAGLVPGFARTVHHIDSFADARLTALQARAIAAADAHFVVSRQWQAGLRDAFDIHAQVIGNGVDLNCFSPHPAIADAALRARLGLGEGPVFLSVGGVEARKNTLRILEAFARFWRDVPVARLVIAGGTSLLDHSAYQQEFQAALAQSGLLPSQVIVTGPLSQADMPSLYRIADALVFASVKEGFGLAVLEAMASGVPVVLSRIAPFIEYAAEDDAVWCDPLDVDTIACAMALVLHPERKARLTVCGHVLAASHGWDQVALAHLPTYEVLKEVAYA